MTALAIVVSFALGAVLGLGYFVALRWNVRLYLAPGPHRSALAIHAVRLVAVGGVLVMIARAGAGPLLAATGGLLVARGLVLRAPEVP